MKQDGLTRRQLLTAGLLGAGAFLAGTGNLVQAYATQAGGRSIEAKFLGEVAFIDEPQLPQNVLLGSELDSRLYTDFSSVDRERLVTPGDRFYVRTGSSKVLPPAENWVIRLRDSTGVEMPSRTQLESQVVPLGLHLMECAGNSRETRFSLMGVADWQGVPIAGLLDRAGTRAKRVLVSGFDNYASLSRTSVPGASWIFTPDQLHSTGAFLASTMNGAPLSRDHGSPFRLVVPGWYGCVCIKWVQEIALLGDDGVEATSQMREYASRTNQRGIPSLAREFAAPVIETAALPVRVEKWRMGSALEYRVLGVTWGTPSVKDMEIQFYSDEPYVPVDFVQSSNGDAWRVWEHRWKPAKKATCRIQLRTKDRSISARRLDAGHYMRSVVIEEI